jgi:hypothetical protein
MERRSNAEPSRDRCTSVTHPLVIALFPAPAAAVAAARALHGAGVSRDRISVISRNHDEESALATDLDATPGSDIEDSTAAARLGELSGHILAAIALVLPGVGPIVAAGPLAAGLSEAAGHMAGGIASALHGAGIEEARADAIERAVKEGAILLGVHTSPSEVDSIRAVLRESGASQIETATWPQS